MSPRAPISIQPYSKQAYRSWQAFCRDSVNATLFHDLDFLAYHGCRFTPHHLMFYKGTRLLGLLPLALLEEEDGLVARSPYGGSFGGIVQDSRLKFRHALEMVEVLIAYLHQQEVARCVMVPPPVCYYRPSYTCHVEFALLRAGFQLVNREVTSVVPLHPLSGVPFNAFIRSTRRNVRKAVKSGVTLQLDDTDYAAFYGILEHSRARHGAKPTHRLEELYRLRELIGARLFVDMAYLEDQPIGGVLYFRCAPQVLMAFYLAHLNEYGHFNPVSLLLSRRLTWAQKQGFSFVDLGTSSLAMQPRESLFVFKEGFGAVGYFRDTYLIDL